MIKDSENWVKKKAPFNEELPILGYRSLRALPLVLFQSYLPRVAAASAVAGLAIAGIAHYFDSRQTRDYAAAFLASHIDAFGLLAMGSRGRGFLKTHVDSRLTGKSAVLLSCMLAALVFRGSEEIERRRFAMLPFMEEEIVQGNRRPPHNRIYDSVWRENQEDYGDLTNFTCHTLLDPDFNHQLFLDSLMFEMMEYKYPVSDSTHPDVFLGLEGYEKAESLRLQWQQISRVAFIHDEAQRLLRDFLTGKIKGDNISIRAFKANFPKAYVKFEKLADDYISFLGTTHADAFNKKMRQLPYTKVSKVARNTMDTDELPVIHTRRDLLNSVCDMLRKSDHESNFDPITPDRTHREFKDKVLPYTLFLELCYLPTIGESAPTFFVDEQRKKELLTMWVCLCASHDFFPRLLCVRDALFSDIDTSDFDPELKMLFNSFMGKLREYSEEQYNRENWIECGRFLLTQKFEGDREATPAVSEPPVTHCKKAIHQYLKLTGNNERSLLEASSNLYTRANIEEKVLPFPPAEYTERSLFLLAIFEMLHEYTPLVIDDDAVALMDQLGFLATSFADLDEAERSEIRSRLINDADSAEDDVSSSRNQATYLIREIKGIAENTKLQKLLAAGFEKAYAAMLFQPQEISLETTVEAMADTLILGEHAKRHILEAAVFVQNPNLIDDSDGKLKATTLRLAKLTLLTHARKGVPMASNNELSSYLDYLYRQLQDFEKVRLFQLLDKDDENLLSSDSHVLKTIFFLIEKQAAQFCTEDIFRDLFSQAAATAQARWLNINIEEVDEDFPYEAECLQTYLRLCPPKSIPDLFPLEEEEEKYLQRVLLLEELHFAATKELRDKGSVGFAQAASRRNFEAMRLLWLEVQASMLLGEQAPYNYLIMLLSEAPDAKTGAAKGQIIEASMVKLVETLANALKRTTDDLRANEDVDLSVETILQEAMPVLETIQAEYNREAKRERERNQQENPYVEIPPVEPKKVPYLIELRNITPPLFIEGIKSEREALPAFQHTYESVLSRHTDPRSTVYRDDNSFYYDLLLAPAKLRHTIYSEFLLNALIETDEVHQPIDITLFCGGFEEFLPEVSALVELQKQFFSISWDVEVRNTSLRMSMFNPKDALTAKGLPRTQKRMRAFEKSFNEIFGRYVHGTNDFLQSLLWRIGDHFAATRPHGPFAQCWRSKKCHLAPPSELVNITTAYIEQLVVKLTPDEDKKRGITGAVISADEWADEYGRAARLFAIIDTYYHIRVRRPHDLELVPQFGRTSDENYFLKKLAEAYAYLGRQEDTVPFMELLRKKLLGLSSDTEEAREKKKDPLTYYQMEIIYEMINPPPPPERPEEEDKEDR